MKNKTKIALIVSGGSMINVSSKKHDVFYISQLKDIKTWLSELPELSLLSEIEPIYIQGDDDSFTHETIDKIAKIIYGSKEEYDGFVILCPGRYLVRCGVALEFMLQGFSKSIMLTGSRFTPESIKRASVKDVLKRGGLGLRSNIINALQVVSDTEFIHTGIMFGNRIVKPTHAMENSLIDNNYLRSVDNSYLGKVDFGITLNRKVQTRSKGLATFSISKEVMPYEFDLLINNIDVVREVFKEKNKRVLLLRLKHGDELTKEQADQFLKAFRIIVIFSEQKISTPKCINLSNMTWETAQIKTMWAKKNAKNIDEFKRMLQTDLIFESINI